MATKITPETPAMVPPNGGTSNFVDPPDYFNWTLSVGVSCMEIMTLFVSMRTYTKAVIMKDMKHEDCELRTMLLGCSDHSTDERKDIAILALVRIASPLNK